MLNRSSNTTLERSLQPHESVEHARKYTRHSEVPPGFPALFDVDEEDNHREEPQELTTDKNDPRPSEKSKVPEIFQLIFNDNFHEMLDRFLVPGHDKALQVRAELYRQRADRLPGKALLVRHSLKLEALREQLYCMQSYLFNRPGKTAGAWIA